MSASVMPPASLNTQSYQTININFWDIEAYSHTVLRLKNSYRLCDTLCGMLQERAQIEKNHAVNLRKWSAKWKEYISTNREYGGCKTTWNSFCTEAEEIAAVHEDISSKLENEVSSEVKQWQKRHFRKSRLPPGRLREVTQLDNDFQSAQQPWSQLHKTVHQTQKSYYSACRELQNTEEQLRKCEAQLLKESQRASTLPASTEPPDVNGANTLSTSQRQTSCPCSKVDPEAKKLALEQKMDRAKQLQARARQAYEIAIQRLKDDEGRYKREMTEVFNAAQEKENERILFFQQTFEKTHQVLSSCLDSKVSQIYSRLSENIAGIDPNYDLDWWTKHYGTDMELQCPEYEEYDPDARPASKGLFRKHNTNVAARTIHRPSIVIISTSHPVTVATSTSDEALHAREVAYRSGGPVSENGDDSNHRQDSYGAVSGSHPSLNHIDGATIVPKGQVRAIYNFSPVESDELSLKEGEIIEKLEDVDDQGWCTGRKNGRIGYYPATYVEALS